MSSNKKILLAHALTGVQVVVCKNLKVAKNDGNRNEKWTNKSTSTKVE